MNNEEIQALMGELQKAGLTPEDIADGILWPLFRDGKMSKEDLATLCSSIGLELDEDFEADEHAEPSEEESAVEGITKEEAEAAKEIEPGESKEEFAEKLEEDKLDEDKLEEEKSEDESEDESEGDGEESEEEEWEEAKKLFKL